MRRKLWVLLLEQRIGEEEGKEINHRSGSIWNMELVDISGEVGGSDRCG